MKGITIAFLAFFSLKATAQESPTELAKPIVEEGKRLYKSEMASWYGTDLFLGNFKDQSKIGGYFSYVDNNVAKCIFYSKGDDVKVLGTISFDSTYDSKTARMDLTERNFSAIEKDYYTIRQSAFNQIRSDTMFKRYKNSNLNLVPLINDDQKMVYVLTGPENSGVVIFGNDYLLTFDKDNKLLVKKQLHRNIIPINYGGKEEEGKEVEATIHSHLPETGDFITATDICTLMLYEKFTKWKQHNVISRKYLNIWNCETDQLLVIPTETIEKINKDQEKRRGKSKNE